MIFRLMISKLINLQSHFWNSNGRNRGGGAVGNKVQWWWPRSHLLRSFWLSRVLRCWKTQVGEPLTLIKLLNIIGRYPDTKVFIYLKSNIWKIKMLRECFQWIKWLYFPKHSIASWCQPDHYSSWRDRAMCPRLSQWPQPSLLFFPTALWSLPHIYSVIKFCLFWLVSIS